MSVCLKLTLPKNRIPVPLCQIFMFPKVAAIHNCSNTHVNFEPRLQLVSPQNVLTQVCLRSQVIEVDFLVNAKGLSKLQHSYIPRSSILIDQLPLHTGIPTVRPDIFHPHNASISCGPILWQQTQANVLTSYKKLQLTREQKLYWQTRPKLDSPNFSMVCSIFHIQNHRPGIYNPSLRKCVKYNVI